MPAGKLTTKNGFIFFFSHPSKSACTFQSEYPAQEHDVPVNTEQWQPGGKYCTFQEAAGHADPASCVPMPGPDLHPAGEFVGWTCSRGELRWGPSWWEYLQGGVIGCWSAAQTRELCLHFASWLLSYASQELSRTQVHCRAWDLLFLSQPSLGSSFCHLTPATQRSCALPTQPQTGTQRGVLCSTQWWAFFKSSQQYPKLSSDWQVAESLSKAWLEHSGAP